MKKKIFIILSLIILIIAIFFILKVRKLNSFEDILFLKIFQKSINIPNEKNDYFEFNVNGNRQKIDSIDLISTANANNLVKEKIAPGTKGKFDIGLKSNKKSEYNIEFISKNEKPKNLKFCAYENNKLISESNSLEELSTKLQGEIEEKSLKVIHIEWCWDYENDGMQDTKDTKIKQYEFSISVIGKEC